ncbi:MAG TPA: hypothetical protein VEW06_06465 [Xanthobacteraceae bacterium]|nr:hypothetical protein [Xanthobacteraceae bacterium]
MASELGNLFISLGMQTASFDQALRQVDRKLQTFSKNATTAFSAIKGLAVVEAGRQVLGWAQSMAAAGDEAEDLALTLGTTLEKVVELQGAFTLATGSLAEATAGMTRMNAAVQDARGGAEGAKDNFAAIGITMQDLNRVGSDTTAQLKLLADRWNAYRDSGEKTRVFQALLGKSFASVIEILQGGSKAVDEHIAKFKALDPAAEEAKRSGAELNAQFKETTVSIQGLVNRAFVLLQPHLVKAAESMGLFARQLRVGEERADGLLGPIETLVGYLDDLDALAKWLDEAPKRAAAATRAALGLEPLLTVKEAEAAQKEADKTAGKGGTPVTVAPIPSDITYPGPPAAKPSDVPPEKPGANKGQVKPKAGIVRKGGGGGGKSATAADDSDYDAFADHIREVREEELAQLEQAQEIRDLEFDRNKQRISQQLDLEKISATEAIQLERDLVAQKWTADQEYYARKREAAEGDREAQQKIDDTVAQEHERHLTKMEAIDHQKAKSVFDRLKEGVRDFGSVIESSFSNIFDSVIEGTFRFKNALSSLMRDFGKMLASRAFKMIMEGPEGGGGLGGILTTALGGMFRIGGAGGTGLAATGGLGYPGMASGGSFRVGGAGSIDSQMVAFRASPGEMVDVTRQNHVGRGGGEVININLNPSEGWVAGVADQRIVTASGQIVNVAVLESQKRTARNFGSMSAQARDRQL